MQIKLLNICVHLRLSKAVVCLYFTSFPYFKVARIIIRIYIAVHKQFKVCFSDIKKVITLILFNLPQLLKQGKIV